MTITVNGTPRESTEGIALAALLAELELAATTGVAVAVNQEVVPATQWQQVVLSEGDQVLVIQATQGG
ncbi:sulfur carrier protein ThiS [Pelagicoccus sp. SDUM812002]|uniref:sulfur carrier protein ThiS n=1 Tax=Pelagicoccus sp. SDUM812002 TaxID=3041266 RepID=UPI00280DD123|nr:sulfur carrier protein ThiS [Pelagicoccus sp. SDUM812002]MDQ8184766.1 sulfur carrier protein ThiS [Pelagicoccus sp. SDUM812002]